jgi:hypothetical protein
MALRVPKLTGVTKMFSELLRTAPYQDFSQELAKSGAKPTLDRLASTLRVGLGISKTNDGQPALTVAYDQKNSAGAKLAEQLVDESTPVKVSAVDIGRAEVPTRAQIIRPRSRVTAYVQGDRLAPGSSVSHAHGQAATLGAFIREVGSGRSDQFGFVSSSALSLWGRARRGDPILSPGVPDGVRTMKNRVGELHDFCYLVPSNEEQDSLYNSADLCHVVLQRAGEFQNIVPLPRSPNDETITVHSVASEAELFDCINRPVFKVGRTTGWTRGTLSVVALSAFSIVGGDGRKYLFTNCALIESESPEVSFSSAGDSGAMVYSENGVALGSIIGGTKRYSIMQPLSSGLGTLGLELA